MATCCSQSDRFKRCSSRTMTGSCRSLPRTQQGENILILLRTQVDRTDKTPVTARRARVGSLCRFRRPAERVPAGNPKTGCCADVREHWRKWQARSQHQMERATSPRTSKREKSRDFERCGEKAGQSRGVVRAPRRSHLPAVRAVSGIYEGVPNTAKNSRRALRNEKSPPFQGKQRGSNEKHEVNTEKW